MTLNPVVRGKEPVESALGGVVQQRRKCCGGEEKTGCILLYGINTPASCDHSSCHAPLLSSLSLSVKSELPATRKISPLHI